MARAKKNSAKAKTPTVTAVAKTPEEIQRVRNKITNVIMDESPEMAKRLVRSVNERGNVATLKYLWEVAGLFPVPAEAEDDKDDTLAKTLLQRMGLSTDMPGEEDDEESDVESE
jgi:hypothetical protein